MMPLPGLGIVKGMALTLRRFFEPKATIKYPEVKARRPAQVPRPPPAALRRVRHAQVRDLLPVRPGLPDRVHRHGRHRHEGPLPRPLGPARDLRRAARRVRPAALRPDRPRPGLRALRPDRSAAVDEILEEPRPRPEARCSRSSRRPRPPTATCPSRALKLISQKTGRVVRDDLRHRLVLPPPPVRAAERREPRRRRSPSARPTRGRVPRRPRASLPLAGRASAPSLAGKRRVAPAPAGRRPER